MSKSAIRWDEANLQTNSEEALQANRMKIDEPKTPFHYLEGDGEEPKAFPPKAAPAKAAGHVHGESQLTPGMDLSGSFNSPPKAAGSEHAEDAKSRFEKGRKEHYKVGSLAELRKRAAEMDAQEEEEEEDS